MILQPQVLLLTLLLLLLFLQMTMFMIMDRMILFLDNFVVVYNADAEYTDLRIIRTRQIVIDLLLKMN